jgi:hypothetical protein
LALRNSPKLEIRCAENRLYRERGADFQAKNNSHRGDRGDRRDSSRRFLDELLFSQRSLRSLRREGPTTHKTTTPCRGPVIDRPMFS